jgi:hypothetical protein
VAASKTRAVQSAAEIAGLDRVTRIWGAHLQLGTALDSEEVGITVARTPEGILDNARSVIDTLRNHEELPFAAQALSELETTYGSAKETYDAAQALRVAVQVKQRELHAVAAAVQRELVKLRTVVRIVLGSSHLDFQRLRLRNARIAEAADASAPETAPISPESDRASAPTEISNVKSERERSAGSRLDTHDQVTSVARIASSLSASRAVLISNCSDVT